MNPREEGRLAAAVERLSKEITAGYSMVEKRLDRVEKRFDRLEMRFDRLENRFDRLETGIDGVDQRFVDVENNFDNKFLGAVKWVGVVTGTIILAGGFAIWALIGVIWMFIDK